MTTPEGRLLREARTDAKLSLREAAAAVGMSLKQWGETERGLSGGNPPPARTLALMAGHLGITPDQLTVGRDDAAKILGGFPDPGASPEAPALLDYAIEELIAHSTGAERETLEFLWLRLLDADGRLQPREERARQVLAYAREHRPETGAEQAG